MFKQNSYHDSLKGPTQEESPLLGRSTPFLDVKCHARCSEASQASLEGLVWLEHSAHTSLPRRQLCLIGAHSLPTNHGAKSELEQLVIVLINPRNFMHGQSSANLLIPDRNLLAGWENEKTKADERFYLGGHKSWPVQ